VNKKILEEIKKEYKKRSREIINYIFKSYVSLAGLEFDSLTESDLKNAKFIHWPSLAKRNEIIYKKYEEEKTTNLNLIVDETIFFNEYYYGFFLEFRELINKEFPSFMKKYLVFPSLGKKISLNNNIALNKLLKDLELEKIDEVKYEYILSLDRNLNVILSDFLHKKWRVDKLNRFLSLNYFIIALRPRFDDFPYFNFLNQYWIKIKFNKKISKLKKKVFIV